MDERESFRSLKMLTVIYIYSYIYKFVANINRDIPKPIPEHKMLCIQEASQARH